MIRLARPGDLPALIDLELTAAAPFRDIGMAAIADSEPPTVAGLAAARSLPGLTLTTFADVPWNGPYYARRGFQVVPSEELPEGLREIRRHEIDLGLDAWPRVAMVRLTS